MIVSRIDVIILAFQFYKSTIITIPAAIAAGASILFQFYKSTIITDDTRRRTLECGRISILQKYDYNDGKVYENKEEFYFNSTKVRL